MVRANSEIFILITIIHDIQKKITCFYFNLYHLCITNIFNFNAFPEMSRSNLIWGRDGGNNWYPNMKKLAVFMIIFTLNTPRSIINRYSGQFIRKCLRLSFGSQMHLIGYVLPIIEMIFIQNDDVLIPQSKKLDTNSITE